jgi:methylmalonyl-CoA mutase C-terminal domain/subunit
MEVIYTGLRQTPEQIATAVAQEDVDVLMLSILSGAHNNIFPRIMEELRNRGISDILVMAGGIIPQEDIPGLKSLGIKEVFGPGTELKKIVNFIQDHVTAGEKS